MINTHKINFSTYRKLCSAFWIILIMFVLQKIRKTVSKIDMFSSSQMLRYDEDAHYQTFTGGIISLGIILTVIAGFFSMISETVNRTAINSSLNVVTSSNPSAYNLTNNVESMFMFGLQIQSSDLQFYYDMNGPRRYFNVDILANTLRYGMFESIEPVPMVKCTDQHWKMIPELVDNKNYLMYETWLCPSIDSKFLLSGAFVSSLYQLLRVSISKCTNESDPSRPCYPQEDVDQIMHKHGNFYFSVNYINTVVNPNQVEYRSYYLQQMDYVFFSQTLGSEIYYVFSDYQIQTDTSIWPFSSYTIDKGAITASKARIISYMVSQNGEYAVAYINKAPQSLFYRRQVQKLSVVFSYIGGLVGAISAVLFILKLYTDTSLQISIAKSLFKRQQNFSPDKQKSRPQNNAKNKVTEDTKKQQNNQRFSLITFIRLNIYQLFKGFKYTQNWTDIKEIEQFREEIGKHLDIKNLLMRIINLERYLSYTFDEKQLPCLKHQQPIKFNQIKQLRKIFTYQNQEVINQIQQLTSAENQIYKIDENACNQLIESSMNNDKIPQSPSPLIAISQFKLRKIKEKAQVIQSCKKQNFNVQDFKGPDDYKVKQCFKELRRSKQVNIISRKLWENARSYCKQLQPTEKNHLDIKSSNIQKLKVERSILKITFPSIAALE